MIRLHYAGPGCTGRVHQLFLLFLILVLAIAPASKVCAAAWTLTDFVDFNGTDGQDPQSGLTAFDGDVYGATRGGAAGTSAQNGTVFELNMVYRSISDLRSLTGINAVQPVAGLSAINGSLYGVTRFGGANGDGEIIQIHNSSDTVTDAADFTDSTGSSCGSSLTAFNGHIYGLTEAKGGSGNGSVFEFDPSTHVIQNLASFTGSDGSAPFVSLTPVGTTLYGVTSSGGANGAGDVFKFDTKTNTITDLADFTGSDGNTAIGNIAVYSGNLYGTCNFGGSTGSEGDVFEFNTRSDQLTDVANFTGSNGLEPTGGLTLFHGKMYGTATGGGSKGKGDVFQFDPKSDSLTDIANFNGKNGSRPTSPLLDIGGALYGGAYMGGGNYAGNSQGWGDIFEVKPAAVPEMSTSIGFGLMLIMLGAAITWRNTGSSYTPSNAQRPHHGDPAPHVR